MYFRSSMPTPKRSRPSSETSSRLTLVPAVEVGVGAVFKIHSSAAEVVEAVASVAAVLAEAASAAEDLVVEAVSAATKAVAVVVAAEAAEELVVLPRRAW